MYLSKLGIINYKSCKKLLISFYEDKPNTFIGGNDCGKSAVLKAIGLLLDPKNNIDVQSDDRFTSDISNSPIEEAVYKNIFDELGLPSITIESACTIVFGELIFEENELSSDSGELSTLLQWSMECFNNKKIYLMRVITNDSPQGTFYICCKDKKNNPLKLWTQLQSVLETHISELKITASDISNENNDGRFTNLEKIRAIYKKTDNSYSWTEYNDFKKDLSKGFFPSYRYIDWNTSFKDLEAFATAAMASKISDYKDKLQIEAKELGEKVTMEVNKVLDEEMKNMSEDLPSIKALKTNINFDIQENVTDIMVNKDTNDGDIRIESQGEGIKKQIWFALLKLNSLRVVPEGEKRKRYIWCFDEPEIHLYPSAQRELYGILKKLTGSVYQIFISTHSTIFVDKLDMSVIKQISLDGGYSYISECESVDDIHNSLGVKNSDFLFFDRFLAFEGDTEEVLIPHFYNLIFNRTIEEDNIQTINLGGETVYKNNKELFENLLRDFKKSESLVYYVLDSDSKVTNDNVCLVGQYDLEDSLSDEIWIEVVKSKCGIEISKKELTKIRSNLSEAKINKFYKLLIDLIASKNPNDYLAGKGKETATLIKSQIKTREDIPTAIVEFFENKFSS